MCGKRAIYSLLSACPIELLVSERVFRYPALLNIGTCRFQSGGYLVKCRINHLLFAAQTAPSLTSVRVMANGADGVRRHWRRPAASSESITSRSWWSDGCSHSMGAVAAVAYEEDRSWRLFAFIRDGETRREALQRSCDWTHVGLFPWSVIVQ